MAAASFLCQTLRPELEQLAARFPASSLSPRTQAAPTSARGPVDDIAWGLDRVEGLWRYAQRAGVVGEEDSYFASHAEELDQQIAKLERQLEAVRAEHLRGRAALLRGLAPQRGAALAGHATTGRRVAPAGAGSGEAPARLEASRLVNMGEFDPTAETRAAAEEAAAPTREQGEAQRAALRQSFELERGVLEAKIQEACETSRHDQEQHNEVVRRLEARLEAARADPQLREAAERRLAEAGPRARRRRLSPLEGAQPQQDAVAVEPVQQWGSLVVGWLGLTSYPSKPRRWNSCMAAANRRAPLRIARGMDEAVSTCSPEEVEGGISMDASMTSLAGLSGRLRSAGLTRQRELRAMTLEGGPAVAPASAR